VRRFADETPEVVISVPAPASVAALFETAIAAFTARGEPRWRGFERLLENVRTEWNAWPRHHDPVFARDGHWELGTRRHGSPLLTLVGDRYVNQ